MTEFASTEQEEAACAVRDLALSLQDFLYYEEGIGVSDRSRNVLEAAYKPILKATQNYFPDALYYEGKAPGRPFTKKEQVRG
jgi:hypothetical protein